LGTVRRMLSKQAAMTVRALMESGSVKTHEPRYYAGDGIVRAAQNEHGTSHVSIVDGFNNAVAVTSSINLPFGAGFMSSKTGIIYNNQMDDFATSPDRANAYGLKPAPENAVRPGKRPLSSMSPTILLHNNRPYMVVGGSGGPRIISATLQAIINVLDWGDKLGDAISAPRLHHQLEPNIAHMESVLPKDNCELYRALKRPSGVSPGGSWSYWPSVCRALKEAGHNVTGPSLDGVVQATLVVTSTRRTDGEKIVSRRVYAASDPRKIGLAAAY
jgi:gamma-glutamyltranspeptidase / glutathione hydrolase